jgi:hypothetical protein
MPRGRTVRTPRKRALVLEAISHGLTMAEAAHHAGMSRRSIFEWRHADPSFAADVEAAYDEGTDRLEAVARRRAADGSDALLIFLLRQRCPERFGKRLIEHVVSGDPANPIPVEHRYAVPDPQDEVVRFYIPDNGRDRPDPEDEPPLIEGVAGEEAAA